MARATQRQTSTPTQRLLETQRVFQSALNNEEADYKEATTLAQVKAIKRNLAAAESVWLQAGQAILDANGAQVEAAYKAARDANDEIDRAREEAVALAQRIRLVASAIASATALVKAARK